MLFAQSRGEPQHQLHALDLVKPIGERRLYFTLLWRQYAGRAAWPKPFQRERAITVERPVSSRSTPHVVFREESNDGNPASSVDAQLLAELFVPLALHETQIDLDRIGFGDPLEQWTLLDTVAAPNAAVDKNLHLTHKAGKELLLRRVELSDVVDLRPA